MNNRENSPREQHLDLRLQCPIWQVTVNVVPPIEHQETQDMKIDRWLRVGMVVVMLGVFVGLDWLVLGMVQEAVANDAQYIAAKLILPNQRLISENVYMSLIGATVLKTAAVTVSITNYLFPKRLAVESANR
jgi:hypothetical protein